MRLTTAIMLTELMAGGPGSGCNPDVGVCGRPPKAPLAPGSGKGQYAHYGKSGSKKLMGVWVQGTAVARLYTELLTGEWKKVSDLQEILNKENLTAKLDYRLYILNNAGKKLGSWELQYQNGKTEVRMVAKKDTGNETKATEVTDKMAYASKKAVQDLLKAYGLDSSFSAKVLEEFAKNAGLPMEGLNRLKSNMSSWVGSAKSAGAMWMKAVAAEYYGRDWSKEHAAKQYEKISPQAVDPKFKETLIAVKSLAGEFAKADGTHWLYRGMTLKAEEFDKVRMAVQQGKPVQIPVNALTGWSTSLKTANNFGHSIVMRQWVEPKDVWVTSKAMAHLFGSYAKQEKEWLIGSKEHYLTLKPEDIMVKGLTSHVPAWFKT